MADELLRCCYSDQEKKSERSRSKAIDKSIAKEKMLFKRTIKILLLGTGESGKSTFLKQMRIIHGNDFDVDDTRKEYRSTVYSNIVKGSKVLIDARQKLDIPWGFEDSAAHAKLVFSYENNMQLSEEVFLPYVPAIRELWTDSGIKTAFDRRREFQLGDGVKYFLDNLDRIGVKDYVPSKKDILYSRKATKVITEHLCNIKGVPFLFIDVGGQRSQRQKWYQCFEGVTSILFITASSEFDQTLAEDRTVNRLVESCNIFETIVNNKCFRRASIILLLNKTDLLEEKIKRENISDYFPEYEGDDRDLIQIQSFLFDMFDKVRKERSKQLFHHFTMAVDTQNIEFVFHSVKETILHHNLEMLMLH